MAAREARSRLGEPSQRQVTGMEGPELRLEATDRQHRHK
jgi:hypothetical protein